MAAWSTGTDLGRDLDLDALGSVYASLNTVAAQQNAMDYTLEELEHCLKETGGGYNVDLTGEGFNHHAVEKWIEELWELQAVVEMMPPSDLTDQEEADFDERDCHVPHRLVYWVLRLADLRHEAGVTTSVRDQEFLAADKASLAHDDIWKFVKIERGSDFPMSDVHGPEPERLKVVKERLFAMKYLEVLELSQSILAYGILGSEDYLENYYVPGSDDGKTEFGQGLVLALTAQTERLRAVHDERKLLLRTAEMAKEFEEFFYHPVVASESEKGEKIRRLHAFAKAKVEQLEECAEFMNHIAAYAVEDWMRVGACFEKILRRRGGAEVPRINVRPLLMAKFLMPANSEIDRTHRTLMANFPGTTSGDIQRSSGRENTGRVLPMTVVDMLEQTQQWLLESDQERDALKKQVEELKAALASRGNAAKPGGATGGQGGESKGAMGEVWDGEYFWNHEYRHYLRHVPHEVKQGVWTALREANLQVDGKSPQHEEIIVSLTKDYPL